MFYRTSAFPIGDEGNNLILERKMKKILSIDGGGIRGIIPAMVLAEIERITDVPTAKNFDLIAGTSTGGILALGLSMRDTDDDENPRYSAEDLAGIYAGRGHEIFRRPRWRTTQLVDEKYSHEGLEAVLDDYFGETLFEEAFPKAMVTTYDLEARRPLFLKSWIDEHANVRMKDAARATSAAPTFFEPAQVRVGNQTRTLVDGGIFINTPSVSAYAEARKLFPDEKDFFVLSIGTGQQTREIKHYEAKDWGLVSWVHPLLYCMFDGVSDAAHYQMRRFLGDENYIRLQVSLGRPGDNRENVANDDMDDASPENIAALTRLAQIVIASNEFQTVWDSLMSDAEAAE